MTGAHQPNPNSKSESEAREVPVEVLAPDRDRGADAPQGARWSGRTQKEPASAKGQLWRTLASLALAAIADGLEAAIPPLWLAWDALAVAGFFMLWGFRWEIAIVLVPELIPGMNVFPTWTLLALYLGQSQGGAGPASK